MCNCKCCKKDSLWQSRIRNFRNRNVVIRTQIQSVVSVASLCHHFALSLFQPTASLIAITMNYYTRKLTEILQRKIYCKYLRRYKFSEFTKIPVLMWIYCININNVYSIYIYDANIIPVNFSWTCIAEQDRSKFN